MKKYIALILCLVLLLTLSACKESEVPILSREEAAEKPLNIDFSYTLNVNNEWVPVEEPSALSLLTAEIHRGIEKDRLVPIEVFEPTNDDLVEYYNIHPIEGSQTAMMQAWHGVDHFFLITQLPEGADPDELVAQLEQHRPCEWCPGEGPEGNTVVVSGNYVLLLITEPELTDGIVANFKAFTSA